jgi:hypothetical protein
MAEQFPLSIQPDLVDAIRSVLRTSDEPLTLVKLRDRLTHSFGVIGLQELREVVERQVAAHVLTICPKYRSDQDRYWDRPLREHTRVLVHEALRMRDGPASWSELRKKLPKYLRHLAESVLSEELARGVIFRHPGASKRMGPRYALQPAEARDYAGRLLQEALDRLEQIGFARGEAREAMMQLLNEEEWGAVEQPPPALADSEVYNTGMF